MHPRYPATSAEFLFSDDAKIARWWYFTKLYALEAIRESSHDDQTKLDLIDRLDKIEAPDAMAVRTREQDTGHDVVAFLQMATSWMGDDLKAFIHNGLTSSDLVENAHFQALFAHAAQMRELAAYLTDATARWIHQDTGRHGRTHGQVASPTSWNHQMRVQHDVLAHLTEELVKMSVQRIVKSPGPTGNDPFLLPRAYAVAKATEGEVVFSTQMIHRDYQLEWAALYLRLVAIVENIAMLIRCGSRSEIDEIREGAAATRVGSSSMPHKHNPIEAEKLCGLARVARGYFATIAENVTFWDDRDISNSSVERITIPDFAAVVEYMTATAVRLLNNLEVRTDRAWADKAVSWTSLAQRLLQDHGNLGPIEAGAVIRAFEIQPHHHWQYLRQRLYNYAVPAFGEDEANALDMAFSSVVYTAQGREDPLIVPNQS